MNSELTFLWFLILLALAALYVAVARGLYPTLTTAQMWTLAIAVLVVGVSTKLLLIGLGGPSELMFLIHRLMHIGLAAMLTLLAVARIVPTLGSRHLAFVLAGTVVSVVTTLLPGLILAWAIQGAILGLTLGLALHSANPAFAPRHVALICSAWALGMFLATSLVYPVLGYPFAPYGVYTVERFITNSVGMATIVVIGGGATLLTARRVMSAYPMAASR